MSLLSSIICSLGFRVIAFGLSPIFIPFPLRDVYALITDASISFPTLFIRSLVEVHRSSIKSLFIHRILLDLGLEDFPASEPIHIIVPIGSTFLRQRVT